MSIRGTGNFDNNYGIEYLLAIVVEMIDKIEKCLEQKSILCCDLYVFPGIDILITLAQNYPKDVLPALEEQPISQWKEESLQIFDRSVYELDEAWRLVRRQVIVATFDKLEQIVQG
jgi:hypothetical protein